MTLILDHDGIVALEAHDVQDKRLAIFGAPGTGKTNALARIVEQMFKHNYPFIVLDPHAEYFTLSELVGDRLLIVGPEYSKTAFIPMLDDLAEPLADYVYENQFCLIIETKGMAKADRDRWLLRFFKTFWGRALFGGNKSFLLAMDEAHNFIPEGFPAGLAELMITIALEGRKFGIAVVTATQTPTAMSKRVLRALGVRFLLQVYDTSDVKLYVDRIPGELTPAEKRVLIASLDQGEAVYVNGNQVERIRFYKRETLHIGNTPDGQEYVMLPMEPELRRQFDELVAQLRGTTDQATALPYPVPDADQRVKLDRVGSPIEVQEHPAYVALQQQNQGLQTTNQVLRDQNAQYEHGIAEAQEFARQLQETLTEMIASVARMAYQLQEAGLLTLPESVVKGFADGGYVPAEQLETMDFTHPTPDVPDRAEVADEREAEALKRRMKRDRDRFEVLLRDILNWPERINRETLLYLMERDGTAYSMQDVWVNLGLTKGYNKYPTAAVAAGLVKKLDYERPHKYLSTARTKLADMFPSLDADKLHEEIVKKLHGQLYNK